MSKKQSTPGSPKRRLNIKELSREELIKRKLIMPGLRKKRKAAVLKRRRRKDGVVIARPHGTHRTRQQRRRTRPIRKQQDNVTSKPQSDDE